MNDLQVLITIVAIFLIVGGLIPFVHQSFNSETSTYDDDAVQSGIAQEDLSAVDVFVSMGKMFFWTFGDLPFWLDLFFVILRAWFYVVLARTIRGVSS